MRRKYKAPKITAEQRHTFEAVRDGRYTNFALLSVLCDGHPTVAIVAITDGQGEEKILSPLYVAVTDRMQLLDPEGVPTTTEAGA